MESIDKSMSIKKILNAPIELVWEVWTDPDQIAKWWGPNGFTNTIQKMDLVPGGEWRLVMHGPDGKNYNNRSEFKEIIPHKKIAFQHFNPNYLGTVIFEAKGQQTILNWIMEFETIELYDTVVKVFKADEGLKQNIEKLDNYLHQKQK
jgi:uncharacterized protein YndB with AHSA1/START domain